MRIIQEQLEEENNFKIIDNYDIDRTEKSWKMCTKYEQLRTGDLFRINFIPSDAVIIGMLKSFPTIRGILSGDLEGFAPLLYFEDKEQVHMKGFSGFPKITSTIMMEGCYPMPQDNQEIQQGMLKRANEYLHSNREIYSGNNFHQRNFIDFHRKEIGDFLEEMLNNLKFSKK